MIGYRHLGYLLFFMSYTNEVEQWRQQREASLKADGGWLTLAGLIWLHEGENTVGSDPGCAIRLPRGPAHAGVVEYHGGKAAFKAQPGGSVRTLQSDAHDAKPDEIKLGDFTFFVIHRGERDAIRLKDNQSEARKAFTGLHWFPIKEQYHVVAKWTAYDPPKIISVPNILGETEKSPSPGIASFHLNGQDLKLEPIIEDGTLFFIFRDLTTGKETYPAGRFLHSAMPKDGVVVMDFNEAYNPPCAFTPYATCPLPPKQNRMAVRIEAGELNYGHH